MKQSTTKLAVGASVVAFLLGSWAWVNARGPIRFSLVAMDVDKSRDISWSLGRGFDNDESRARALKRGKALYQKLKKEERHPLWSVRNTPPSGVWYAIESWFGED